MRFLKPLLEAFTDTLHAHTVNIHSGSFFFCFLSVYSGLFLPLSHSQVVEDGYEFFAKRQLVTLFSAPNYCGEFDNAGAMMSVDETLMCSFQVSVTG